MFLIEEKFKWTVEKLAKHFWNKVEKKGKDECWPFLGCVEKDGRGRYSLAGKTVRAHKVAWILSGENGIREIPRHYQVRHNCKNKACCNPAHLYLKLPESKRIFKLPGCSKNLGVQNGNAKLTEAQAKEIKASGATMRELVKLYEASIGTIHQIKTGKTWGHV